MTAGEGSELIRSVATAADPRRTIAALLVEQTYSANPLLSHLLQVTAVPRKFDESLLAMLSDQRSDDQGFSEAVHSLLGMPFVVRRHDGMYRIHDGIRGALLAHLSETAEGMSLLRDLDERLADWYATAHNQAREVAHQFDSVAALLREVSPDRMLAFRSAIEKQLVRPLTEALHHATAADSGGTGLARFQRWFDLYESEHRVGICRLLLRSWRNDVERLPGGAADATREWCQYYAARLALAEGDRETARTEARKLLTQPELSPKIRVLSQELLTDTLIEDGRLGEALQEAAVAVRLRSTDDPDPWSLWHVFTQQATIHRMLFDCESRAASLEQAMLAARSAHNRESEATILTELSAHYAAYGNLADATSCALDALHIVRTFRPAATMITTMRFAAHMTKTFGARDPRLADLFHIEAAHLIPGDDLRSAIEVEAAYVVALMSTGQFERAHRVLDRLETRAGGQWPAGQSDVQMLRANLLDAEGREKEAVRHNQRRAQELTLRQGNIWDRAAALTNAATTEMDFVDLLDEAQATAIEARELWQSMGHSRGVALTDVVLAEVSRRRGDYAAATDRLGAECPEPAMGLEDLWYRTAARVADDLGRHDEAAQHLRHLLGNASSAGHLRVAARTSALLVEILIRAGHLDDATEIADVFTETMKKVRELREYSPAEAAHLADEHNGRAVRLLSNDNKLLADPVRLAVQHLEEAISGDPVPFWYSLNQAYAFLRLGDKRAVRKAMKAAEVKAAGTPFEKAVHHLARELAQFSWA